MLTISRCCVYRASSRRFSRQTQWIGCLRTRDAPSSRSKITLVERRSIRSPLMILRARQRTRHAWQLSRNHLLLLAPDAYSHTSVTLYAISAFAICDAVSCASRLARYSLVTISPLATSPRMNVASPLDTCVLRLYNYNAIVANNRHDDRLTWFMTFNAALAHGSPL